MAIADDVALVMVIGLVVVGSRVLMVVIFIVVVVLGDGHDGCGLCVRQNEQNETFFEKVTLAVGSGRNGLPSDRQMRNPKLWNLKSCSLLHSFISLE